MFRTIILLSVVSVVWASGCAGRQAQSTVASSAEASHYALQYPEQLEAESALLAEDKAEVQRLNGELAGRASEIKGNDHGELLLEIVDKADEAGRGESFAEARAEARVVRAFINEERGPVSSRVSGAAQQKLSEAKCENVEVSGVISYALKDGVDKQLDKRLRAHNEAQLLIERHKATFGQANVTVLQKLADDVALASYLVNVALPEDRSTLQRRVDEQRKVKSTLEDAVREEQEYYKDPARTEPEKRASEDRTVALTKSQSLVDPAVTHANEELKDIDKLIETARADYDKALTALKDALKQRTP